jgi:CubicO group peptidase (beta-lactamase class C family)
MLSAVLALAVGAGLGSSAAAQARPTGVPERLPDGPSASAFTDADLVALINQTVASQLADKGIAGAVVSVVHDGAVVLSRGYGSSDTNGTQPDPARTLFRVGSVTKLFTATAVMQLVEAGKLDLDQDIDSYLDFRVSGAQPITLRHLLTHTAGFEDAKIGYLRAPGPQPSRSAWLKDHVPALVRPPGQFAAYSNYGLALAGYIVQRVAGMPYEEYIQTHLLDPLGMTHTSLDWPVQGALAGDVSNGFTHTADGTHAATDEAMVDAIAPAGALSTTAQDMTRFMLAHLQDGALNNAHILDPKTAQLMHARAFGSDPRINGMALGFAELSRDGVRIIGHEGDTSLFHTLLALFPDQHLGIFVSYNTDSATNGFTTTGEDLLRTIADHLSPPITPQPLGTGGSALRVAGEYLSLVADHTSVLAAQGLLQGIPVEATDDRTLIVHTPSGRIRFVEIEPLLFRSDQGELLAFREGDPAHAFLSSDPTRAYERLPWYQSTTLNLDLLQIGLLALLSVPLAATGGWLLRLARRRPATTTRAAARWARRVLLTDALLAVAAVTTFATTDRTALLSGQPTPLGLLPALTGGMTILTAAALVQTLLAWRGHFWTVPARVHYNTVAILTTGLLLSAHTWHLTGW